MKRQSAHASHHAKHENNNKKSLAYEKYEKAVAKRKQIVEEELKTMPSLDMVICQIRLASMQGNEIDIPDWFKPLAKNFGRGLADRALYKVFQLMIEAKSERVQLASAQDLLDRAGIGHIKGPMLQQQINISVGSPLSNEIPKGNTEVLEVLHKLAALRATGDKL